MEHGWYLAIMNGSGIVAEGGGRYNLKTLTLTGTDTAKWNGTGIVQIGDTMTINSLAFYQSKAPLYIPTNSKFTIRGTSQYNRFNNLYVTDRVDRDIIVRQKVNIIVDSFFNVLSSKTTSIYDFSGQSIQVNGEYKIATASNANILQPDSLSSLVLEGSGPSSAITFKTEFRKLKAFVHNKAVLPANIAVPITIKERIDLFNGELTGVTNITLSEGATVRRSNGSIATGFNNASGKINLEYWASLKKKTNSTLVFFYFGFIEVMINLLLLFRYGHLQIDTKLCTHRHPICNWFR